MQNVISEELTVGIRRRRSIAQPRVNTLGKTVQTASLYPEGVIQETYRASIPDIRLVEFYIITSEEFAILILKCYFAVMLLLFLNVATNLLNM